MQRTPLHPLPHHDCPNCVAVDETHEIKVLGFDAAVSVFPAQPFQVLLAAGDGVQTGHHFGQDVAEEPATVLGLLQHAEASATAGEAETVHRGLVRQEVPVGKGTVMFSAVISAVVLVYTEK